MLAGQLVSMNPDTWSSAMLSLITMFVMICSRGQRRNWRMELEDGKQVEQDEEQHGEKGEAEDVGGER